MRIIPGLKPNEFCAIVPSHKCDGKEYNSFDYLCYILCRLALANGYVKIDFNPSARYKSTESRFIFRRNRMNF